MPEVGGQLCRTGSRVAYKCKHAHCYAPRRSQRLSCRGGRQQCNLLPGHQRCKRPQKGLCSCRSTLRENGKVEDNLGIEGKNFPFDPPKTRRFRPFIGQSDVRDSLKKYSFKGALKDKTLRIEPMKEEHLQAVTTILTDSFADSIGYMPIYRGYLRRQVEQYLQSHLDIAPKAIILVATLHTDRPTGDTEAENGGSSPVDQQGSSEIESLPSQQSEGSMGSAEGNPAKERNRSSQGTSSSKSTASPEDGRGKFLSEAAERQSGEATSSGSGGDNYSHLGDTQQSGSEDLYSSFSDKKARSFTTTAIDMLQSGYEDASKGAAEDSEVGQTSDADVQEFERELEVEEAKEGSSSTVIGTVELSFNQATRTTSLTLNPPPDAAFLCNMAVATEYQRQGVGMLLLQASEAVVQLTPSRRLYLQVRLRDKPAQMLYKKAGYDIEKEDCLLVSLWEYRRRLLSKFIPRTKQPVKEPNTQLKEQEATASEF